jgi:hypothetical protein
VPIGCWQAFCASQQQSVDMSFQSHHLFSRLDLLISFHLISSHDISCRHTGPHLISPNLISSHVIFSNLISSHLTDHFISSNLIQSHFISPHLFQSHFISPHFISCRLNCSHLFSCHLSFSHLFSAHLNSSFLMVFPVPPLDAAGFNSVLLGFSSQPCVSSFHVISFQIISGVLFGFFFQPTSSFVIVSFLYAHV